MPGKASSARYLSVPQKVLRMVVSVIALDKPKSVMTTLKSGNFSTRKFEIAVRYPLCKEVTETVQCLPKSGDVSVIRDIGFHNVTMLLVYNNKGIRRLTELNYPHHLELYNV